jgi:hypothetical protein
MQAIQYKQDPILSDQNAADFPVELVNGTFSGSDMREMFLALLDKQINAYKIKNWKSQVNNECPDSQCMSRIQDINDTKRLLAELCEEANIQNKEIRVRSRVTLEFVNKQR